MAQIYPAAGPASISLESGKIRAKLYHYQNGADIDKRGKARWSSAMPRTVRVVLGGMVFHVLNPGIARMQVFEKTEDYGGV
jgi:hypothetical protein